MKHVSERDCCPIPQLYISECYLCVCVCAFVHAHMQTDANKLFPWKVKCGKQNSVGQSKFFLILTTNPVTVTLLTAIRKSPNVNLYPFIDSSINSIRVYK